MSFLRSKEQQMLQQFNMPTPPVSTQQSSAAEAEKFNSTSKSEQYTGPTSPLNVNNITNRTLEPRTLWMGDLDPWVTQESLMKLWWFQLGKKVKIKIITPKVSNKIMDINPNVPKFVSEVPIMTTSEPVTGIIESFSQEPTVDDNILLDGNESKSKPETEVEYTQTTSIDHKIQNNLIDNPKPESSGFNFVILSPSVYCFVEFELFEDAQQALLLNGQPLPDPSLYLDQYCNIPPTNNSNHRFQNLFRLNWAAGATLNGPIVHTPDYLLFVGDLSASTTEAHVLAFFQKSFPNSIKTVRVMTNPISGKSRCFGFVRFATESSRQEALVNLQGSILGGRSLRLALATQRKTDDRTLVDYHNQHYNNSQIYNKNHANSNDYTNYKKFNFPYNYNATNVNIQGPPLPPLPHPHPPHIHGNKNVIYNYNYNNISGLDQNPYQNTNQHFGVGQSFGNLNTRTSISEYSQDGTQLSDLGIENTSSGTTQSPPYVLEGFIPFNPEAANAAANAAAYNHASSNNPIFIPEHNFNVNTTVFVGGISLDVSEDLLFQLFKSFGAIVEVKLPPAKNCGFVKYTTRQEAETAIREMQGYEIGSNRIRLGWGRLSKSNRNINGTSSNHYETERNQYLGAHNRTYFSPNNPYLMSNNYNGNFNGNYNGPSNGFPQPPMYNYPVSHPMFPPAWENNPSFVPVEQATNNVVEINETSGIVEESKKFSTSSDIDKDKNNGKDSIYNLSSNSDCDEVSGTETDTDVLSSLKELKLTKK